MYVGFTFVFSDRHGYVSFIAINSTKTLGLVLSRNGHTHPILGFPRVVNLHIWKITLTESRLSPNNAKNPTKLNKKTPNQSPQKPTKTTPNKCISFPQTSSLSPTSPHHRFFLLKRQKWNPETKTGNLKSYSYTKLCSLSNYWLRSPRILFSGSSQIPDLGKYFCPYLERQLVFPAATMGAQVATFLQNKWRSCQHGEVHSGKEAEQRHEPDLLHSTYSHNKPKNIYRTNCFWSQK